MTDYGKGGVLGAASALPATTGAAMLLSDNAHPIVIAGLFLISAISLFVLIGTVTRYIINSRS